MQSVLNYQDFYNLLIGRTPHAFNRALGTSFKKNKIEISKEHWSILAILREKNGCSQQYLAQKSFRDRPSISRLIDKMEKDGLVERRNDKNDRRLKLIFLTSAGKSLEKKIIPLVHKTIKKALTGIDNENIMIIKETFEKINQNLDKK
ncbi:MAG: MarR family winged helix-turn-helix transcriptional regulator [Mesonia hippocampi]|uniref:MarR family winged helix-turn-helix transcriptional regulator n=1 Tax=Mesonia hippocampi TaxID=1628250 RepID=UPI003F9B9D86